MIQTSKTKKEDLNAVIKSSINQSKTVDVTLNNNIVNIYNTSLYISSMDNTLKQSILDMTYYKTLLEEEKRITGSISSYVYDNVMYCYVDPYIDKYNNDDKKGMYRLHQYYSTNPGEEGSSIDENEYNERILNGAEPLYYSTDAFENKKQYLRKHDGSWPNSNQITVIDENYDHCVWIRFDTLKGRTKMISPKIYDCYWYVTDFSLYSEDPPQKDGTEPKKLLTQHEAESMISAGYLPIYYCTEAKSARIYISSGNQLNTTWEPYVGHLGEVYAGRVNTD